MIIEVTIEEALAYPEPKQLVFDGARVFIRTESDIQPVEPTIYKTNRTRLQLALLHFDKLDLVEGAIAASNDKALQILWASQEEFWSNHPKLVEMGVDLGIDIEAVFAYADSIDISAL